MTATIPSTALVTIQSVFTGSERLALAGFCKYTVEEDLLEHSPAAHVRRPRLDYESHATAWTATSPASASSSRARNAATGP